MHFQVFTSKMDVLKRKKTLHISSSSLPHDRITSFSLSSFCHQKAMKFKEMCSLYIIQCSFPVAYFVNSVFRGFEMMRRQGMASFHQITSQFSAEHKIILQCYRKWGSACRTQSPIFFLQKKTLLSVTCSSSEKSEYISYVAPILHVNCLPTPSQCFGDKQRM